MFRKHGLLNGNCVAAALLLLAAAQPAVGQKQAGEADVVYRNGSTIASEIPIRSGSFLVKETLR